MLVDIEVAARLDVQVKGAMPSPVSSSMWSRNLMPVDIFVPAAAVDARSGVRGDGCFGGATVRSRLSA